jgi:hypothetical protein
MDELEQCLRHIKKLKENILKQIKDKEEKWQRFCVLLELGTINDQLKNIPYEKRLRNAKAIEFIYVQIIMILEIIKDRKSEKRKQTIAEKYWKEREKVEYRLWRQGKDWKKVGDMPKFASAKSLLKDYPHPYYRPSPDHMKNIEIVKHSPGRPEKDLRYFLVDAIKSIKGLSFAHSRSELGSFRSDVLEKLFQLLFG